MVNMWLLVNDGEINNLVGGFNSEKYGQIGSYKNYWGKSEESSKPPTR
jgi:hypothetical protein